MADHKDHTWTTVPQLQDKTRNKERDIMSKVKEATGQTKMDKSNAEDWVNRKMPAAERGYE